MSRSRARLLWSNPGKPRDSVARALGMAPRRFGRALHKIKAAGDLSGADRVIIDRYTATGRSAMSRTSRLATSTTKTDAKSGRKAFVTLRFAGDDLDPEEISEILPIEPARAHRKGEEFLAGPRAGNLRGRTGIWFLATDKLIASDELRDHLAFVQKLLCPTPGDQSRIQKLRDILARTNSSAHVTCFWRGEPGEPTPKVADRFTSVIAPLAADIETDFAVEKDL